MNRPTPAMVVFLDSLPHRCLGDLPFLSSLSTGPVKPGFGYSMNIKAQLFAGLTPDMLGQLCSWNPVESVTPGFRFFSMLSPFDEIPVFTKWSHRIGSRLLKKPLAQAPLGLLKYFGHHEIQAYEREFEHPSLLDTPGTVRCLYGDLPAGEDRDKRLFAEANRQAVEANGLFFVGSADLDHIGHLYGVGSDQHSQRMRDLDTYVGELVKVYSKANPGAPVVILSDHGMANVTGSRRLDVEKELGPMHPDKYLCATDATMARFWSKDASLVDQFRKLIEEISGARMVTDEERRQYGVTDPKLGDAIAILDEGLVFCPSFYFRSPPKAMHGYHPDEPDQTAFIAALNVDDTLPGDVSEVYPFLAKLIGLQG